MHGDDGAFLFLQVDEFVHDDALRRLIDARKRFVHDIELRILRERTCDKDTLLLSARQLRDLAVGEVRHLHLFEGVHRSCVILFAGAAYESEMGVAPHEYDIKDGRREVPVHRATLRHVGNLLVDGRERLAPEAHRTRDGLQQTEDALEEGRFSRAVRSHDRAAHTRRDIEVDVPEHRRFAVCHCEIFDVDHAADAFHFESFLYGLVCCHAMLLSEP